MATKDKVTVSVDEGLIRWVDGLVEASEYETRSAAMEAALVALHWQRSDQQLEAALAGLMPEDVAEEIAMAEEGVEEWAAQLNEFDGGWGSAEVFHAAR